MQLLSKARQNRKASSRQLRQLYSASATWIIRPPARRKRPPTRRQLSRNRRQRNGRRVPAALPRTREKERQKNQEKARQREAKANAKLEKLLVKEAQKEKEEHPVTQVEAAYLQELRREGQALEIQAIRYVRDPVTARRIFQHIQHCTYDLNLLEGALQQASFRHHALMPRLLAEGKLTERDAGLISSAYGKTLLSLSGIQDMQNSIREWIKSFVPEGEEMGDVSGSQIAGVSQAERLLLRLAPRARRVPFPLYRCSWLAPDYEARLIRQADEDRLLHADGPEDGEEGETETEPTD